MSSLRDLVGLAPRRMVALPVWLERLASVGIVSGDPEVVRRQRFTNMFAFASAANILTHVGVFCIYDPAGLAPLIAVDAMFFLGLLAVPLLHRVGVVAGAHTVVAVSIVAILFTLVVLGRDSQIYVYFALSGIILFLFGVENARSYVPWFLVMLVGLTGSLPYVPDSGLSAASDPLLQRIVSSHAMINVAVVNAIIIYFVVSTLRRTELSLEDQYERSSMLAATLLPASVVERLTAAPEARIADRIEGLSVLFADLAGFTTAARGLPPEQVVDYLDEMVRAFDALCAQAGAEKIKTIGDCYMAVGDLSGDAGAGARAAGRLAVAMLEAQAALPPLGAERLALRIGIHAGDVTAGVIGDRRFSYDVWGETVNMASRLESQGAPGRIHVSAAFRTLAGAAFDFEERGTTEIRGIGAETTYFLDTARRDP